MLLGELFSFIEPSVILIVLGCLIIYWGVQIRSYHQRYYFFHDFCQSLCWSPFFSTCFDHLSANISFFINVWMIDFGIERDKGSFEGEVFELELDFELSSFKRCLLWTCNVYLPQGIIFDNDIESSNLRYKITLFRALLFIF